MTRSKIEAEVAVIGGGLAGVISALQLARSGHDALLIRKGYGATAMSSSCISSTGLARWLQHRGEAVPGEVVNEAFDLFTTLMSSASFPFAGSPGQGADYLTTMGTCKRVELLPLASAGSSLKELEEGSLLIVGIEGLTGFRPAFLQKALRHYLGERPIIRTISFRPGFLKRQANLSQPELAHLLDEQGVLGRFMTELKGLGHGDSTHWMFPPVLGLEKSAAVMNAVRSELKVTCFEAISKVPSPAGIRLQTAINRLLSSAGIRIVHGTIIGFEQEKDRITRIKVQDKGGGLTIEAGSYVLASGNQIGGGLDFDGKARESVFGIPLSVDEVNLSSLTREQLLSEDFSAQQSLLQAGIRVDRGFRPLNSGGEPFLGNLRAAGSVIATRRGEKGWSGLGFAMVSGYVAARSIHQDTCRW